MNDACAYCEENLEIHGTAFFSGYPLKIVKFQPNDKMPLFCNEDHMIAFVAMRLGHKDTKETWQDYKNYSG